MSNNSLTISTKVSNPGSATNENKVKIVVLGCGYAGALTIKNLEKEIAKCSAPHLVDVTVIDQHPVFWMKISGVRATVDSNWIGRSQIPISEIIKTSKFVLGRVASVNETEKTVTVNAGLDEKPVTIPWDILVCATGVHNASPTELPDNLKTIDEIKNYLKSVEKAVQGAKRIAIIGGGATSVEYAGEIRNVYKDKQITIVCASKDALASCVVKPSRRYFKYLYQRLKANNIDLLLGHRCVNPSAKDFHDLGYLAGERTITLTGNKAQSLNVDLVIWAGSWKFNNSFYPQNWLNELGELEIVDTFQLQSRNDCFAFGDISGLLETKQAITLPPKVPIVVQNILSVANDFSGGKLFKSMPLKKYTPTDRPVMYLPIGSKDGASLYRGWTFGGATTSKWKGQNLFTDKFRVMLTGQPYHATTA